MAIDDADDESTCSLGPSKTIVTRTPSSSLEPPGRGRKCISELQTDIHINFWPFISGKVA